MRVIQTPEDYPDRTHGGITIWALESNKRPIGFARDWPEEKPKKKRKKKRA